MADQTIGLPVDGIGKKIDTEELLVSSVTVQRERNQLAGKADTEICDVKATDPLTTHFGVVVRQAPPINPKVDAVTSASLVQGASVDLDATTISAATTGKLMSVLVASSVACKWEVKSRDGAVLITYAVIFTDGLGSKSTFLWEPKSKDGVTLVGNGVDENFRVTATNQAGSLLETADVYATLEWDEV
jgi:hypothetical protein